ncbi:MAG: hypothetical protein L0Y35_08545 [Flammeovirgaceae bacterium]|nr:hypothetical protein [Flammeovirgaceae bacterium]
MRGKMGDAQRLAHIKEVIAEIEEYVRNIDLIEFKEQLHDFDLHRLNKLKFLEKLQKM